jgi:nitric oxide reductase NorD protein
MSMHTADEDDVEPLRLIASAIAGRAMEVAVAHVGVSTWWDGATVYVERGATPEDQIRMLAVQASLLAAGSFDPDILRHLLRRPGLGRRYLAVEGHRALLANEPVLPPLVCPLIDHDLARSVTTAESSLALAGGRGALERPPRVFGVIDVKRVLASIEPVSWTPIGRSVDNRKRWTQAALASLEEEQEGQQSEEGVLGNLLSSPVGGQGAVGRLLQRMLSPVRSRSGGGPSGNDAPTHVARRGPNLGQNGNPSSSLGERDAVAEVGVQEVSTSYPEWDEAHHRYRPDWCTVVESDAPADTATMEWPNGFALRRSLSRLGTGMTRCRRQPEGDDLDIDGAVDAHIDMVAGAGHGDDVYLDSRRRRRDLGVLVLLDVSGSAGEPGAAGRSVHEHQRLAAIALTGALHDLGDRVALYAFNSRGRQSVRVLRVKGFDDRLGVQVTRRLAGLEPAAYTRLGAAIRHGSAILEQRSGTPRRLLVVLSDGFAYDHGYADRYGEADARRSLTEARRRGIGCLCLSVGANADPETLRRVFGSAAHARMSSPDALPDVIAPLFHAAVRSAERQQRAVVRHERTKERLEVEMEMR